MPDAVKMLYEDPKTKVTVDEATICIEQATQTVILSHAEMRELDLAWTRHELRERE